MIPTIRQQTSRTIQIENDEFRATLELTSKRASMDGVDLLYSLRTYGGPNNVELADFLADIEDRRSSVEILGAVFTWEDIAHVFHDLDADSPLYTWVKIGVAGPYTVWERTTPSDRVVEVTDGAVPTGASGYTLLSYLFSLRNIDPDSFIPITSLT